MKHILPRMKRRVKKTYLHSFKKRLRLVFELISYVEIYSANILLACSTVYHPPIKFDSTEYIFIGKIAGYIGPLRSQSLGGEFWAVLIQPVYLTYVPQIPPKCFEIIPYNQGADCKLMGLAEIEIKYQYPIGHNLRVVGRETKFLKDNLDSNDIRLDINPYNNFDLSMDFDTIPVLHSSPNSEYDYNNAWREANEKYQASCAGYSQLKKDQLSISFQNLFHFELRKDLFRLAVSRDSQKTISTLRRLAYFPYYTQEQYIQLVDQYVVNKKMRDELMLAFKARRKQ